MKPSVLIVDDEIPIRDMIRFALGRTEFDIVEAGSVREAQARIADRRPDAILLDWMLPDLSGIELARRLKKDDDLREIPIIMLTARGDEDDKIMGLESGADDYIIKPFSPRELMARIKAVLRRTAPALAQDTLTTDGLEMHLKSHRVTAAGSEVRLGPTEFKLLHFFMTHPERVYSRSQLLDQVWGGNVYVEERTVDVHIRRLRKALEPSGHDDLIQTVRGSGYRFSPRK